MKRMSWLLQRAVRGGPVAAALVLLLACLAALPIAIDPARQQLSEARRQLALAEARGAPADDGATSWEDEAAQQLETFYTHLRSEGRLPELLATIHQAAEAEGLVLQRADYRLSHDPQGRLSRYQILLPIAGPYPRVRSFISQVLQRMPAMALEQVVFERKRIGDGKVEARLRFTLHLVKP